MKQSDTPTDGQTGQFLSGAAPLGTVTRAMVTRRAKEIAVINGRNENDFTPDDLDQARLELTGLHDVGATEDLGDSVPAGPARDEQTVAEDLVQQGVEEATHDQMLAGSRYRADRDKL
jgi:hypothetical protein